jgi:hypothetical protein
MMAQQKIELTSPEQVFPRGVAGIVIASLVFLFWTPPPVGMWVKWLIVGGGILLFTSAWRKFSDPQAAWRYFWNAGKFVRDLITEWKPEHYRFELEYEKDLHAFLKTRIPFAKITRQYGSVRIKCDLAVGNDVMIELKVKLKSTNKLQRLLGQIELFQKEWSCRPLVVVLLGEADEDLLHELHGSIRRFDSVHILTKEAQRVVEESEESKPVGKTVEV